MTCLLCEDEAGFCENHPDQPFAGARATAVDAAVAPPLSAMNSRRFISLFAPLLQP